MRQQAKFSQQNTRSCSSRPLASKRVEVVLLLVGVVHPDEMFYRVGLPFTSIGAVGTAVAPRLITLDLQVAIKVTRVPVSVATALADVTPDLHRVQPVLVAPVNCGKSPETCG